MENRYYVQKQNRLWAVCHVDDDGVPVTDALYNRKRDAIEDCLLRWAIEVLNSNGGEGAPRRCL